jgi:hypothetical protein
LTEELKEAEYPVGTRDGKRAFDLLFVGGREGFLLFLLFVG